MWWLFLSGDGLQLSVTLSVLFIQLDLSWLTPTLHQAEYNLGDSPFRITRAGISSLVGFCKNNNYLIHLFKKERKKIHNIFTLKMCRVFWWERGVRLNIANSIHHSLRLVCRISVCSSVCLKLCPDGLLGKTCGHHLKLLRTWADVRSEHQKWWMTVKPFIIQLYLVFMCSTAVCIMMKDIWK